MKNLGKIIIIFIMTLPAFASLSVSVDKASVTRGERVTFTLKISGEGKVRVPPLDSLCGYDIESRMQSRKDIYTNGKREQELSLMYEFMPQKSCVIEAFPVSVNDVEYMTEAINVNVSKMSISKNEPFEVQLEVDKHSVYVGEPFEMRVNFQQRNNIQAVGESISLPDSKNIWIKSEHKGKGFVKNGYQSRSNMYAMSAQQSGKLTLGPLRWDLQVRSRSRDYWGSFMQRAKTRSVFSNEIEIDVKPLPEGVDIVGDLQIKAYVDKKEIHAGEAVNITIEARGSANVEDIASFNIHLEGAQAFNEEPKVSHFLQNDKYFGTFVQKSALVAEKDFTIPAFELTYMDVATDEVRTIKTEPIAIKVINTAAAPTQELKVSRPQQEVKDVNAQKGGISTLEASFLLLGGVLLGLILGLIPWKNFVNKQKGKHKVSAKESKEVLQLLMSNMDNDAEIEGFVKKISENLYEGKSHEIDKKRLKEILKTLQA